jgi:hypothetical protein
MKNLANFHLSVHISKILHATTNKVCSFTMVLSVKNGTDISTKSYNTKQLRIHTFKQYSISSLIKDKLCFILDTVLKFCFCPALFRRPCLPANDSCFENI